MILVVMLACQGQTGGRRAVPEPGRRPHALQSDPGAALADHPRANAVGGAPPDGDTGPAAVQDTGSDTGVAPEDSAPPVVEPQQDTAAPADSGSGQDTGPTPDTGAADSGEVEDSGVPAEPALEARLEVDVDDGEFPLVVSFDATGSELGSRTVRYEWSFGDGASATDPESAVHTYVGEGEFDATVTVVDDGTGERSVAEITIDVDTPDCPSEAAVLALGYVDDDGLGGLSGMVASRTDPDVVWVHEDGSANDLVAIDRSGVTLSEHDLPNDVEDLEDIASAVDPATGTSMLFLGDIGDNGLRRDDVAVWVMEEPDPYADSDPEPLRMELTYPTGPVDAETVLVDPLTLDLYILTKMSSVDQTVYRKRAPHDDEGPYELEDLGTRSELDFTVTSGDISPDGSLVVVRGYSNTARLWFRDGYRSLDALFDEDPCNIDIATEPQGEAISFTADGAGVVTLSEGHEPPIYYIGL